MLTMLANSGILAILVALGSAGFVFYNSRKLQFRNEVGSLFAIINDNIDGIISLNEEYWLSNIQLNEWNAWISQKHCLKCENLTKQLERNINKLNSRINENEPHLNYVSKMYFHSTSKTDNIVSMDKASRLKKVLAVAKDAITLKNKLDDAFHRNFL